MTRPPSSASPRCVPLSNTRAGARARRQTASGRLASIWRHSPARRRRREGPRAIGRSTHLRRPSDPVAHAFVAAAQRLDIDGMERVLDEAFAAQRFELAMDEAVFPALRAVGRAWADGTLDVAAEHAASETVRRRLARFFDAARGPMAQAQLLVGMPPGGDHELGVFAFAVACRRAGQEVAYLGSNVPLESWMQMVRETAVPAIVLGAVTDEDAVAVNRVADSRRDARPSAGLFRRRSCDASTPRWRRARSSSRVPSTRRWPWSPMSSPRGGPQNPVDGCPWDVYAPCIPTGTRAAAAIPRAPSARSPHHPKVTFP